MSIRPNPCQPSPSIHLLAACLIRSGLVREQKYKNKGWASFAENLQFKFFKFRYFAARKNLTHLRQQLDEYRTARLFDEIYQNLQSPSRSKIGTVTFKHCGRAGDIIYALPTMKALSHGRPVDFFLWLNVPINNWSESKYPSGKFRLTAGMAEFLRPLLEHQPWLSSVQIYQDEIVDYDLDLFRNIPTVMAGRGHNAHWYAWMFPACINLSQPWIELPTPVAPRHKIVLARSTRNHNPHLDYAFLRDRGEIDFVGDHSEFLEMQRVLPRLRYVECSDALQLAMVIKSARFFIGNQSFPFALAEALKVPRILEISPECPVVHPVGGEAGEAFFQPNFEKLVEHFWRKTAS